jgi:hypothetical protein
MLKFTSFKRQEINLVFKIKVFVVSKIWYFNKSIYFYFPKFWVVTLAHDNFPCLYNNKIYYDKLCPAPVMDGRGRQRNFGLRWIEYVVVATWSKDLFVIFIILLLFIPLLMIINRSMEFRKIKIL